MHPDQLGSQTPSFLHFVARCNRTLHILASFIITPFIVTHFIVRRCALKVSWPCRGVIGIGNRELIVLADSLSGAQRDRSRTAVPFEEAKPSDNVKPLLGLCIWGVMMAAKQGPHKSWQLHLEPAMDVSEDSSGGRGKK